MYRECENPNIPRISTNIYTVKISGRLASKKSMEVLQDITTGTCISTMYIPINKELILDNTHKKSY